jgi:tetratricopeptide (TPR) repeat protein
VDELDAALWVSWALERSGCSDEARRELVALGEHYRDDPRAEFVYQRLGDLSLSEGDLTSAINYFQRAMELGPERLSSEGVLETRLAVAYSATGDSAAAEAHLSRAVDAWSDHETFYLWSMIASEARGLVDDAFPENVRFAGEKVAALAESRQVADAEVSIDNDEIANAEPFL